MFLKLLVSFTFLSFRLLGVTWGEHSSGISEYAKPANSNKSYVVSSTNTSWFDAYMICKQYDMELATVETQEEEAQLEEILKNEQIPRVGAGNGYWVSGARKGFSSDSEEFVWFANGKSLLYNKFAAGQPDNAGDNEACIEIFLTGDNYWWNDCICEQKIGFICQSRHC